MSWPKSKNEGSAIRQFILWLDVSPGIYSIYNYSTYIYIVYKYIYIYDIMGIPEIFQSVRAADFYESGENKGYWVCASSQEQCHNHRTRTDGLWQPQNHLCLMELWLVGGSYQKWFAFDVGTMMICRDFWKEAVLLLVDTSSFSWSSL